MEVDPGRPSCGYCGTPVYAQQPYPQYQQPAPAYYPPPAYMAPAPQMGYYPAPPRQPSATPVAGGVLILIGGLLALVNGIYTAAVGAAVSVLPGVGEILMVCAAIQIIFAILALVGGICGIQRKVWGLALVGSIFCMISIGPMFISSILGLIGLILIAISKDDFT
jgi:hypothetical protein